MAFSRTWNAASEAAPADTDAASGGAAQIRNLRGDVRERLDIEHKFSVTDGEAQGVHKFLVGNTAARPAGTAGRLYFNTETKAVEWHDGTEWQTTADVPSGTRSLFHQTDAPTGWTKDTTANLNNTALRVVTGAVGFRTNGLAFTSAFASARPTSSAGGGNTGGTAVSINNTNLGLSVSNRNLALSVNSHSLSLSQIPSHTHLLVAGTPESADLSSSNRLVVFSSQSGDNSYLLRGTGGNAAIGRSGTAGSGGGHSHGLSGLTGNHNHSLSGSTGNHSHTSPSHTHTVSAHTHTLGMNVNYHDVIICTKD